MGNMKFKTLLVMLVAIWVFWLSISVVSARDCPVTVEQEEEEADDTLQAFTTVTFDTAGATKATYRNFLRELRQKLKDNAAPGPHGVPVTRHSIREDRQERYLLVNIGPKGKRVTLGLDVENLYVLGYRDRYQNKTRDHFFKGVSKAAQDVLSKKGLRLNIPFGADYKDLESKAGGREDIELGIGKLESAIQKVYGLPPAGKGQQKERDKTEATFLLIAIQLVSEAARFKHIEEKVLNSIHGKGKYGSFKPDECVTKVETNWKQLSRIALRGTEAEFKNKLQALKCSPGQNSIVDYMGILKYSGGNAEDYLSYIKLYDIVATE